MGGNASPGVSDGLTFGQYGFGKSMMTNRGGASWMHWLCSCCTALLDIFPEGISSYHRVHDA